MKFCGVYVGVDPDKVKKALPDITKSILQILSSPAGDEVKKKALEELSKTFSIDHTTLNNCNITTSEKK